MGRALLKRRGGPALAATRGATPPEMHTYVVFDVPSDKVRRKVCEACKDYGLARFQWSAFEGPMTRARREELFDRVVRMVERCGGRIAVVPVGEPEARSALRHVAGPAAKDDAA